MEVELVYIFYLKFKIQNPLNSSPSKLDEILEDGVIYAPAFSQDIHETIYLGIFHNFFDKPMQKFIYLWIKRHGHTK